MANFEKQSKFETRPIVEQKPFENPATQAFFAEWCKINDSIEPQFIERELWNKLGTKGILERRPDGKQTLFIPKDLRPWEMVGVMEVVDQDTFAAEPERAGEAKERMLALGRTFENAGAYIAKRLKGIEKGREIAEALALEFYEYGQSLVQGKGQNSAVDIAQAASKELTPEETETVDRFLAGDALYESRKKKIEGSITGQAEKDKLYEAERQKTLTQFFRAAEKAFALESKSANGKLQENPTELKPWQSSTPIHSAFLRRIEGAIARRFETPRRELEMAIFRRGLEKLVREMKEYSWRHAVNSFFETLGLNLSLKEKTLFEALKIPQLRAELEAVRQTGDTARISAKEREIADKIQKAVSSFPYKRASNNPSEIVVNQYINCVGASTLGGALMKKAGLNYLVASVPGHSILFLVTSGGQVELRDMLDASSNELLTDEMIESRRKDGKPLTVNDIAAFSRKPSPEGLMFDVDFSKYRDKFSWAGEEQRQYVIVSGPEHGQQIQILNNAGNAFVHLGRYEEAIESYRQAIAVEPKDPDPYNNLGTVFYILGRYEEAIESYRQAAALDPHYYYTPYGLGNVFYDLGRYEEAIEFYRQSVALNPDYPLTYYGLGKAFYGLGRRKEAAAAFRRFLYLEKNGGKSDLVKEAKQCLKELEK